MSTESDGLSRDDPRLNEILAQYLQAVEAGESPDPVRLLREHPEYAEELRQFLTDKRRVDEIAGAVNEASGVPEGISKPCATACSQAVRRSGIGKTRPTSRRLKQPNRKLAGEPGARTRTTHENESSGRRATDDARKQ